MNIVMLEQGSDEWLAEKLGKPSASNASKIVTTKGLPSKQREGYLYELAAERLTGQRDEGYYNVNMLVGNEREQESRELFELALKEEVTQVGVVYPTAHTRYLCSPDGLIKNKRMGLELKNVLPKTQVKRLLKDELPSEYFQQVQMSMFITGYEKWVFYSYSPGLAPLYIEVKADEDFIDKLEKELNSFCDDLEDICQKLKQS